MAGLHHITRNAALPLTLRKKIGKLAKAPPRDTAFEILTFGSTYGGTHGIHMDDKIHRYGAHEASTIRLLRAVLAFQRNQGNAPVYWDIGTNSGFHLTAVSPLADHALGFEPWSVVREKADANLARNALTHVTIMPFGLSDADAEIPFSPPTNNNFGTGSFRNAEKTGNTVNLQVRRGDDVCAQHGHAPTLMKIDIEGHEVPALQGLSATIRNHKPMIVFEYDDGSRDQLADAAVRDALFGGDYRFYGIKRSREWPVLKPFDPAGKYENVLAWPYDSQPQEVLRGLYDIQNSVLRRADCV